MEYTVLFYGMREYDIEAFGPYLANSGIKAKILSENLRENTAVFAFGCDAISISAGDIVTPAVIDELLEAGVRLIAMRGAGYNNIDVEYARGRIGVVRVPDYSPHAIAEFAMALLLTVNRNLHKSYARTRDFNFSLTGLKGFDLYGKTVGVVGEGKIGSCFIDICRGFGMHVLVSTPHPHGRRDVEYVSFDDLCARSDVISLHCPLTKDNHHLINEAAFERMKPNVILVNTGRGGLIDTEALIRAVRDKRIKAAALDVYENEGGLFFDDYSEKIMQDDMLCRLIGFPNVLVTSHQAYFTDESLNGIAEITVNNILTYLKTGKCANEIPLK